MTEPFYQCDRATLYQGDALPIISEFADNSFDLILTDPPYMGVKSNDWDNQWKTPQDYIAWLNSFAAQWQRLLKPNGSLYCFASPQMSARVEGMLSDRFNVLNSIHWWKVGGNRNWCADKEAVRSYLPNTEDIIFCEHYGADNSAKGSSGWDLVCGELRGCVYEPLQQYFNAERSKGGFTYKQINIALGTASDGGGMASHYFTSDRKIIVTWQLPTIENYQKLQSAFPGYFLQQYEDLRRQYEDLRRQFNLTVKDQFTDVWSFRPVPPRAGKHPCEKPQSLLRHIIETSTRPDAAILDCFAGSGATLKAARALDRTAVGVELDLDYCKQIAGRLGKFDPLEFDADAKQKGDQLTLFGASA